ncbi:MULTISPECIES: hypothetical protein [unclassified Microbulbifer]|uniref:hypothetical protein n=1 Tax=unclassified Microbulbifer TaxID=2619833 RepID=UPI0027E51C9A|nr:MULTISPECIES: hypothetical protein [unclassified Microbulbifer]
MLLFTAPCLGFFGSVEATTILTQGDLTQSILAKAFRGELTEQWRRDNPNLINGDNSAALLLERIQAMAKPGKKTRRKRASVKAIAG